MSANSDWVSPPSSVAPAPMSDDPLQRQMFFGLAASRLRARARWGVILAASIVIPYEVIGDKPQWVFQLLRELPPASIVAVFAPSIAGLAILFAARFCARPASLAIAVATALLTSAIVHRLGAEASAWDVLSLPVGIADRPGALLVALALTAAGASLSFKPKARRIARGVTGVGFLLALSAYLIPLRGDVPLFAIGRGYAVAAELTQPALQIGLVVVLTMGCFPLLVATAGLFHARFPAQREQPPIAVAATFGLSIFLAMQVYRAFLSASGGAEVLIAMGLAALVAAIVALLAAATEVVVDQVSGDVASLDLPAGWPLSRAIGVGGASAIAIVAAQAIVARPPKKGVDWAIGARTDAGDALFGEALPKWTATHGAWRTKITGDASDASGASEIVRLKAAERAMLTQAKSVDAGVATALQVLVDESSDLDVAGRRFFRLVGDVNDASRRAKLPYYVDPIVDVAQTSDGLQRTFRVIPFRVRSTSHADVGRDRYTAILVDSFSQRARHDSLLGLSRDAQPFAIIQRDEIAEDVASYVSLATQKDPICGREVASADATEALGECGHWVQAHASDETSLRDDLTAMTTRHELQHQIDGPHLPTSSLIDRRLLGYSQDARDRANRELSAYLAEMTSSAPPALSLVHLLPFALVSRGGAEHHVAVIAFYALTGRDVPRARPGGEVSAERIGEAFHELSELDDDALRSRAKKAWERAFGATLPDVKVVGDR
jgi:hypothetical protein